MSDGESVGSNPEPGRASALVDVRVATVPGQVPVSCTDEVALQLGIVGRTEDVALSPDGRRLVMAGFNANVLAIVGFESVSKDRPRVVLHTVDVVRSVGLVRPHGVTFLDDETLLVANRESELLLVRLDEHGSTGPATRVVVDGNGSVPVRTPGSVAVRRLTPDLAEVLVCNNYAHEVTRYVVDRSDDWRVVDAERLLANGLEIPDGIAISDSGEWIAISNHNHHNVFVYRYDERLGPESAPDGVLVGPNYPHGLRFAADDRCLLLADAGLPYVHAYEALDGDWSGERGPAVTTRVMDDESFNAARYNPQEGGPKGVAVAADGLVVVTSERQPLGFFSLDDLVGQRFPRRLHPTGAAAPSSSPDPASRTFARLVRRAEGLESELVQARADNAELAQQVEASTQQTSHLTALVEELRRSVGAAGDRASAAEGLAASLSASTSWRLTGPLRRLADETVGRRRVRSR